MKKLIILFALIIFCFSCEDYDPAVIGTTGIVKAWHCNYHMYGTHKLESNTGGVLFALTSSSVNLDDYEGVYVEVIGKRIDGYPVDDGPEYIEVHTVNLID